MSLYYKQDGFSHRARMNHTHHTRGDDHGQRACCAAPNEATLKDPVCGMTVTPQSPHHVSHAGNDYFFCSAGCASKFSADPKKYLASAPGTEAGVRAARRDLHVPDASADSSGRAR